MTRDTIYTILAFITDIGAFIAFPFVLRFINKRT